MKLSTIAVESILLSAFLGLRLSTSTTANLSYAVIALWALCGPRQTIQAFALSWLSTMINPGIAPDATQASLGRYMVILAGFASLIFHTGFLIHRFNVSKPGFATTLLGIALIAHSLLFSSIALVSILKAFSWLLTTVTAISAWIALPPHERARLEKQLYGLLVATLIASAPLLFSHTGFLRNGSGFQGVLNHPQAFGPTMAILAIWSAFRLLSERSPTWLSLALCGGSVIMILLSEARTAGIALLLSIVITVIAAPVLAKRRLLDLFPGVRSFRFSITVVALIVTAVSAWTVLDSTFERFITKSGRAESGDIFYQYDQSRGGLMAKMIANIEDQPMTGIGFGIGSHPELMEISRDPIFNLPLGAPIEKGVLPLAIIEEVGVLVSLLIFIWMAYALVRGAKQGPQSLSLVVLIFMLNFGEFTLFSPGGMGLLSITILGSVFAKSKNKNI